MTARTYVVVGGGLAAAKAVQSLRAAGDDSRVVLFADEPEHPYDRPDLSKSYLRGEKGRDALPVLDTSWYAEHQVELELGTHVEAVDRAARTVQTRGSRLRWDKLLLATGSTPRRLPVPGADLDGVHYLRTVADADALRETLAAGGHVVVVGAGWIGLEVAAAARHHGAHVTVLEPAPAPLHAVLGPETGEILAQLHRAHGVDVRTGTGVSALEGASGGVRQVLTSDGSRLEAHAVVVGIGVRPNTELADAAALRVDDGVVVDELLRSVDDPDILAAGDVARPWSPVYGTTVRVEHRANALRTGRAAGRTMAGVGAPYAQVPYFYSDQYDLSLEYRGFVGPGGYDQVVYRGDDDGEDDESQREFVAFWLRAGRVLAAMTVNVANQVVNQTDQADAIEALVRAQARVDPTRLADTSIDLATLAPR